MTPLRTITIFIFKVDKVLFVCGQLPLSTQGSALYFRLNIIYCSRNKYVKKSGPGHEYISRPKQFQGQGSNPYFNKVLRQYLQGLSRMTEVDVYILMNVTVLSFCVPFWST